MLTRHFQQNFGAPYKFRVAVESKGFSEAPDAILAARQRLTGRPRRVWPDCRKWVGEYDDWDTSGLSYEFHDFNELLALGYMQEDKINVSFAQLDLARYSGFPWLTLRLSSVPRRR